MNITNPYLTIAGQSAPGEGVTLTNSGFYIATHDVIIRHIKIRPGDAAEGHNYSLRDAINIGENSYNIMIDHISASWSTDKLISLWYEPQFVTIQWSILSEPLSDSFHAEGEHSKAVLIGDNSQKISIHHNLVAHSNDRAPAQVKGGADADIVNNITYNWGEYAFSFAIDYTKWPVKVYLMNNYFKEGPSTTGDFFSEQEGNHYGSKIYINGNKGDNQLLRILIKILRVSLLPRVIWSIVR